MITAKTIDHLFDKLAAMYGAAWDRSLGNAQIMDVKTVWGEKLTGFSREDIAWALDHLTERCPNVFAFREMCRASPRKEVPMLEAPAPNPAIVAAQIAKQTGLLEAFGGRRDPKAWAPAILNRVAAGDKISPTIVKMARDCVEGK